MSDAQTHANGSGRRAPLASAAAIALWVLVAAALLYGVLKTADAAAALFGA
jgi:hypothetical protein